MKKKKNNNNKTTITRLDTPISMAHTYNLSYQEVGIERIMVQDQIRQKVSETPSQSISWEG
jgi:hypothetical protein